VEESIAVRHFNRRADANRDHPRHELHVPLIEHNLLPGRRGWFGEDVEPDDDILYGASANPHHARQRAAAGVGRNDVKCHRRDRGDRDGGAQRTDADG
jgi:hypothetical protein